MKVIIIAFVVGALAGLAFTDSADSSTEKQGVKNSHPPVKMEAEVMEKGDDTTCWYTKPSEHDRTYTLAILPGVRCVTILK